MPNQSDYFTPGRTVQFLPKENLEELIESRSIRYADRPFDAVPRYANCGFVIKSVSNCGTHHCLEIIGELTDKSQGKIRIDSIVFWVPKEYRS